MLRFCSRCFLQTIPENTSPPQPLKGLIICLDGGDKRAPADPLLSCPPIHPSPPFDYSFTPRQTSRIPLPPFLLFFPLQPMELGRSREKPALVAATSEGIDSFRRPLSSAAAVLPPPPPPPPSPPLASLRQIASFRLTSFRGTRIASTSSSTIATRDISLSLFLAEGGALFCAPVRGTLDRDPPNLRLLKLLFLVQKLG